MCCIQNVFLFPTDIQPLIIDIIRIVANKIVGFITNFKCLFLITHINDTETHVRYECIKTASVLNKQKRQQS